MMSLPKHSLRRANRIRYLLPPILTAIVLVYESWEEWVFEGRFEIDLHLTSEILFFGIIGPAAVFVTLSYVVALLEKQLIAATKLEALNLKLEQKVIERTEALAARNIELARANAELQQLDQLKSDFVSLVSHELRTPLTSLSGGIELALQKAGEIPPETHRILKVMAHESERLTRLVNTILEVSRLEAGKLQLNLGPVAVVPLLRRTVEVVLPAGRREVEWAIPASLPPIWADETYLEEIIRNLLTNADKYSPDGAPVELSAHLADECIQITVTDHGPGIPAERQAQVFERFRRLERDYQRTSDGWGLGLYFARLLADAQEGKLDVRSPVHASGEAPGAAFTLALPVAGAVPEDV